MENRAAFIEAQHKNGDMAELACVMLDINNLRQINDQYGHHAGDHAIISAARAIQDVFGELGTCFCIGGDEFVVLLEDRPMEQVNAALDRMRERTAMENLKEDFSVEIAAGYAARQEDELLSWMVERADAEMYVEKQRMKARKGG